MVAGLRSSRPEAIAALVAALLAWSGEAQAQVGLASRDAPISLVARVPAGAAMEEVSSARTIAVRGSIREAAVTVRLTSNSGYRLIVHGIRTEQHPSAAGRIWVLGVDGNFHQLVGGFPVTVAHEKQTAGESARDVVFRIEHSAELLEQQSVPVRYDVAVNPSM